MSSIYSSTELVTAPAAPVLTTQEAIDHTRVVNATENSYVDLLVKAATQSAEQFLGRKLINQTWKLFLDCFPGSNYNSGEVLQGADPIEFPFGKLQDVTHIKYYDSAGTLTTMSASDYQIDSKSVGRIGLAVNSTLWPGTQANKLNAVEVQFICGYGTASSSVPEDIRQAIRLMVADWYDKRDNDNKIPKVAELLMYPHRLVSFG